MPHFRTQSLNPDILFHETRSNYDLLASFHGVSKVPHEGMEFSAVNNQNHILKEVINYNKDFMKKNIRTSFVLLNNFIHYTGNLWYPRLFKEAKMFY